MDTNTAPDDGTKASAAQELNSRLDDLPLNAQEQYVFGDKDQHAMAEEADMLNSLQLRDKKEFWPKPGNALIAPDTYMFVKASLTMDLCGKP